MAIDGSGAGRGSGGVVLGSVSLACRVVAGGLFLFAAYVKLTDVQAFALSIRSFDFLPNHLVLVTAYVVPWMELLAGLGLVAGLWTRSMALVYCGLLVSFIGLVGYTLARGMSVECGCFGKFKLMCDTGITACNLLQNGILTAIGLVPLVVGGGRFSLDGLLREGRQDGSTRGGSVSSMSA